MTILHLMNLVAEYKQSKILLMFATSKSSPLTLSILECFCKVQLTKLGNLPTLKLRFSTNTTIRFVSYLCMVTKKISALPN